MDQISFYDVATALIGGLLVCLGFLIKSWIADVKRELVDSKKADLELAQRISGIELLVAGEYIKREEFNTISHAIFAKLDRIEDKLDRKVDKHSGG